MKISTISTRLIFTVLRTTKRIWFRSFLYALVGVATALIALFAGGLVPEGFATKIGAAAVGNILTILASSMLAVSTFSLSIMVAAFGNASSGASPRATRLLMQNQDAQRAVATFIGAFLYSIVGIIALATNAYGENGRFLLFLVTIGVIIVIVTTLIRWVDQLSLLGRVGSTIAEVEQATLKALERNNERPYLGGRQLTDDSLSSTTPLLGEQVGFVAFVDLPALQKICVEREIEIYLQVLPGSFVYPDRPIARIKDEVNEACRKEIAATFVIDDVRTFDQDPRFGFVLLYEIASKALSPAINDPGTAIEVIGSAVRLLKKRADLINESKHKTQKILYDRIFVPHVPADDYIGTVFAPMARDGRTMFEVIMRIQKALISLKRYHPEYRRACEFYLDLTKQHADLGLKTAVEKSLVRETSAAGVRT